MDKKNLGSKDMTCNIYILMSILSEFFLTPNELGILH